MKCAEDRVMGVMEYRQHVNVQSDFHPDSRNAKNRSKFDQNTWLLDSDH